jgi:mannobiose 2-epimerase
MAAAAGILTVWAEPKELGEHARDFARQLSDKALPYWYDTAVDWQRGGYLLADEGSGQPRRASTKQIVTQARMVWGFSHVTVKGYRDAWRNYLNAARRGYRFLVERFRDSVNGGYYWKTDLDGKPVNDRKYLYGEAFVIYAFVEYYRASQDHEALERALELFRTIQRHCHDSEHGGWGEHYTVDWELIREQDDLIEVERAGLKSANAHLHWMEALAELYEASGDVEVNEALDEALRINVAYFYPPTAGEAAFHRQPDWIEVTDPGSAGLSYGHNVEFAWLMVRAQQVLGRQPAWDHFHSLLDHSLRYGYDQARGGLYNRGFDDQRATDQDKVWWSQAEAMAALTDSLMHRRKAAEQEALHKLIDFLEVHQIDPDDGIWHDTVSAAGEIKRPAKAHNWKANYHDVRAIVKFIEAFGAP